MHLCLILNPSKSEVMWVGSRSQLLSVDGVDSDLKIADATIKPSSTLKIVGVTLDSQLSFGEHISEVCRTSNFHLHALRHIRPFLDVSTANMLACSIIGSRIDYCNSLFAGMSDYNVQRLQRVQNLAAKIVLNAKGRVSVEPLLTKLHWLPVPKRIVYKVALTTFKSVTTHNPHYLHTLLIPYSSSRTLRSSSQNFLSVPRHTTAFQSRAFSIYAPRIWNRLPQELRDLAYLPETMSSLAFHPGLSSFLEENFPF